LPGAILLAQPRQRVGPERVLAGGHHRIEGAIPGLEVVTRAQTTPLGVQELRHAEALPTPRMGRILAGRLQRARARCVY
jgi:hypothetical protein